MNSTANHSVLVPSKDAFLVGNGIGNLNGGTFRVSILGLNISRFSQTTQFIMVSTGIFIFFVIYGYLLEAIFVQPNVKSNGLYLTFIQFILYSAFAYIESHLTRDNLRKIPIPTYIIISFLTVATMTMSNLSLEYLNYPTQVIFKSCKLIPVLIGGIVIQGKQYGVTDFIAASVMCIGLIWFTLIDVTISPNFHTTGIIMINLALVADAMIGNIQEKAIKTFGASNSEVVLYSYSFGVVYLALALILSGRMIPAFNVANQHKLEMYIYGFFLSLTGYLGLNMVLTLVRVAGAFAAVTVTTCRKALSIIVSFMFFAKPFSIQYVWSGLLVLLSVYLNLFRNQKKDFALVQHFKVSYLKPVTEFVTHFFVQKTNKNVINVYICLSILCLSFISI